MAPARHKSLLFVSLIVAFVGYYMYNPMPEKMDHHISYKFCIGMERLEKALTGVLDSLGAVDERIISQKRSSLIEKMFLPLKEDDPDVQVNSTTFDGVPVVIFEPRNRDSSIPRAGLVYVHGGGYTMGSAITQQYFLIHLVRETGIVAISIDYRLTPQHPYPAAFEDCLAASRYVFSHAAELGIDPLRVGVAGDSAGGNMAAVLPLKFRDMGSNPQFMYQVLVYPWTQAVDLSLPSYVANEEFNTGVVSRDGGATMILSFAGKPLSYKDKLLQNEHVSTEKRKHIHKYISTDNLPPEYVEDTFIPFPVKDITEVDRELEALVLDPYAFPLMAEYLANLPPALVATMGYDTIRDDGLLYLKRLQDDGIDVQHYHDEKGFHGVLNFAEKPFAFKSAIKLQDKLTDYIKKQIEVKSESK